jgi:hypothetical protein
VAKQQAKKKNAKRKSLLINKYGLPGMLIFNPKFFCKIERNAGSFQTPGKTRII